MTIFDRQLNILQSLNPMEVCGTTVGVSGLIITVNDFPVPVGSQCQILRRSGQPLEAEVVGFQGHQAVIMPYDELVGVATGDPVKCITSRQHIPVGRQLMGRVIDGFGNPIDDCSLPSPQRIIIPCCNSAPSRHTPTPCHRTSRHRHPRHRLAHHRGSRPAYGNLRRSGRR